MLSFMRSINLFVALVLIIVAGVVGYFLGTGSGTRLAPVAQNIQDETPDVADKVKFETVVLGEQNDSGQVGIAVLREEDGKVKVNLRLVGQPDTIMQPAHIHTGTCPTPGVIIYPLTIVVDGESETILATTWDALQGQMPLAINVHESEAQIQNYVACGNL